MSEYLHEHTCQCEQVTTYVFLFLLTAFSAQVATLIRCPILQHRQTAYMN